MRFLRTASTGRLLATIGGVVAAIVLGTAIAVAATGSGPVPRPEPLAQAIHGAATTSAPSGITARVTFTNNLISSADFTGGPTDPILQGASGRLWLSDHRLRLELQTSNGDGQVVVNNGSWWVSDPASQTVYEGTLPASAAKQGAKDKAAGADSGAVPSIAKIEAELAKLAKRMNISGAVPGDVAGQPTYRVTVSPLHDGGLLGKLALAWDAVRGVPLDFAVYARGNSTPVLELKATDISYGAVPASDFAVSPPAGYTVVRVSHPASGSASGTNPTAPLPYMKHASAKQARALLKRLRAQHKQAGVTGVAAVAAHVPFALRAPSSAVGLPRRSVALLDWGGHPAALVTYGQGLGAIAVIEQSNTASTNGSGQSGSASAGGSGGGPGGLSLPTVSIKGVTGTELATALGTVIRFTHNGVNYTVIGSVMPFAAEQTARALIP